jgi:HD superfamily phosphodiesterase
MEHSKQTVASEKEFLASLELFFTGKWALTKLWSHDLDHHRRVWNYAKELLYYTENNDPVFISKLLMASLLHDIGMSKDTGERHGGHSMKLCREYLEKVNLNCKDYQDLLSAIENHDNKNYTIEGPDSKLLLLLSVADDLDAFGYTGILRYLEIYMLRGMMPEEISLRVLENSAARFDHFMKQFGIYPELIEKHRIRYLILRDFFQNFNSDLHNSK